MEFSRQGYWSGLPLPSPGDLPDPGIEFGSPTLQADPLPTEPPGQSKEQRPTASYCFQTHTSHITHTNTRTTTIHLNTIFKNEKTNPH